MRFINYINSKYNLKETEVYFRIKFLGQLVSFDGLE